MLSWLGRFLEERMFSRKIFLAFAQQAESGGGGGLSAGRVIAGLLFGHSESLDPGSVTGLEKANISSIVVDKGKDEKETGQR